MENKECHIFCAGSTKNTETWKYCASSRQCRWTKVTHFPRKINAQSRADNFLFLIELPKCRQAMWHFMVNFWCALYGQCGQENWGSLPHSYRMCLLSPHLYLYDFPQPGHRSRLSSVTWQRTDKTVLVRVQKLGSLDFRIIYLENLSHTYVVKW